MVMVVFRSKLRPGVEEEFGELADKMMEIAESMPGFVSYKVFQAEDGERASIIHFESIEQLQAWRTQPEHLAAQQRGRESFYEEYSLIVSEPYRDNDFKR